MRLVIHIHFYCILAVLSVLFSANLVLANTKVKMGTGSEKIKFINQTVSGKIMRPISGNETGKYQSIAITREASVISGEGIDALITGGEISGREKEAYLIRRKQYKRCPSCFRNQPFPKETFSDQLREKSSR